MFNRFKKEQRTAPDWHTLEVEPTGSEDYGPCPCCGDMSRTVWGFVHSDSETLTAYYVQWTLGKPTEGAHFDLIIGRWGKTTTRRDRQGIALEYRVIAGQGSFMVINAAAPDTMHSLKKRAASGKLQGETNHQRRNLQ